MKKGRSTFDFVFRYGAKTFGNIWNADPMLSYDSLRYILSLLVPLVMIYPASTKPFNLL